MKTKIFKPIVLVALSVLTLSINAQNTKSLKFKRHSADQLLASVENRDIMMTEANEELNSQVTKLAEYAKFFPRVNVSYYAEPNYSETFAAVSNELEKDVKYRPEESLVKEMDKMIVINEITKDLEKSVKYNPSESLANYEISNNLAEVLTELEKDVRYKPTDIQ